MLRNLTLFAVLVLSFGFLQAQDSTDVYGCTDPQAINYNPEATIDDGSCIYQGDSTVVYGCTDPEALNYNPEATIDDGSCIYSNDSTDVYGCTDPEALNYNPEATIDDGSCIYSNDSTDVYGCTDPQAINYNPLATIDDGSCIYQGDSTDVYGCTDPQAINYNPLATIDDGSCIYQGDSTDVYGCTDPEALNYNPFATIDDGSCIYSNDSTDVYGCTDPEALNYNPLATIDDGSCIYSNDSTQVWGCTDPGALNYNPYANIDDGSCIYFDSTVTCMAAFQIQLIDPENNVIEIVNMSQYNGTASYVWDFGDGTISTEPYPTHQYADEGMYMICVQMSVVDNGSACSSYYCDTLGLMNDGNKVLEGFTLEVFPNTVDQISESNDILGDITVYPNPATDELTLRYSLIHQNDISVSLYDLSGRIIDFQLSFGNIGENTEKLNVGNLQPGVYLLELSAGQSSKVTRFYVTRR